MGVPETYARGDNFQRKVIDPAILEVNGPSDMGVQIELARLHSRARSIQLRLHGGARPATNSAHQSRNATAAR